MTCIPFLCAKSSDISIKHSQRADCCELAEAHSIKLYSYKELKVATNGFSASNKIGEGGYGSVYSGKLADGRMAAIKTLSSESKQGAKEFLTEILVISDVKHENLVELYGCCTEDNHRMLVYNYLESGSLDRTLLGRGHSSIQFGWQTRVKICVGVAKALAYLHEEVRPHVVHRDIKASNILLDKDLTPKLSDFGLAKLFPPNLTHVSTRVAGTAGYLAPEYAIRGQLTRKADVYSYGVLLVEIVSGRCNTINGLPKEDKYILEKTWKLHVSKELATMVDISLSDDFDVEQACRFLKIGLLCTQDSPKLRPAMSKALLMLNGKMEIDEDTMTRPGLISDFMDSTDKNALKRKGDVKSANFDSSDSSNLENTSFTSAPYSHATMSFTSIYDRN